MYVYVWVATSLVQEKGQGRLLLILDAMATDVATTLSPCLSIYLYKEEQCDGAETAIHIIRYT